MTSTGNETPAAAPPRHTVEIERQPDQTISNGTEPGASVTRHPRNPPRVAVATADAVGRRSLKDLLGEAEGMGEKLKAAMTWLQSTRLMRANNRINATRGNLLAGGVAYNALFSLVAALTVGITVVMTLLQYNPEFRDTVIRGIADAVPGILQVDGGEGLVSPDDLMLDTALNPTTIIAAAVAIWSARAMMMALRRSMRAVAGITLLKENFLVQVLRDVGGFVVLGLTVAATSIMVVASQQFGEQVLDWIGVEGPVGGFLIRASAYVVTFAMDFLLFLFLFRFLAGIRAPRKDRFIGAAIGALGSGVLRVLGTAAISLPDNPVMQAGTAIVTLLLLVNLMVRMALYVTAIMVNPPAPVIPEAPDEIHFAATPNYVTVSVPSTLQWDHEPAGGTLIPDPTLNPEYEPEPEPEPKWGGLIGRMKRRRIARLEEKLRSAREKYYT
ncbi:MAG: YihY/virulence factor BrkB family protein [bacterium]|nr:YihY/virulence factor BrkB family protein [bacterium]